MTNLTEQATPASPPPPAASLNMDKGWKVVRTDSHGKVSGVVRSGLTATEAHQFHGFLVGHGEDNKFYEVRRPSDPRDNPATALAEKAKPPRPGSRDRGSLSPLAGGPRS